MRTTLKTRLGLIGAGTGVAALAVTGLALPAQADDTSVDQEWSTTETTTDVTGSLDAFQAWVTDTLDAQASGNDVSGGDVTLIDGPLVGGDVLSGNDTPVGSGNDVPVGSGNDVSAPVGSGNDTGVEAPVGSGNDVSAPVDAGNGNANGTEAGTGTAADSGVSVGDIGADVDGLVDDVTSDLGLGDVLG
jgi:hypothetical protein